MVIGLNERSWPVDVSFDHFELAKNSGFHGKYILNLQKPIPLRVWGRLGPVRVSQILPCSCSSLGAIIDKISDVLVLRNRYYTDRQVMNWTYYEH